MKLYRLLPIRERAKVLAAIAGKVINMGKLREWLKGKKTYIVCIGAICAAATAWISGEIDMIHAIEAIVAALGALTIHAAVANTAKAEPKK